MAKASHNKLWDMKYTIPSWSERVLCLFKVTCSVKEVIYMITCYARLPSHMYSGDPYYLAHFAKYNLHQVCTDSDSFLICVDNHCLAIMLPNKDHFKSRAQANWRIHWHWRRIDKSWQRQLYDEHWRWWWQNPQDRDPQWSLYSRHLDSTAQSPTLDSTGIGHSFWPNGNMYGQ